MSPSQFLCSACTCAREGESGCESGCEGELGGFDQEAQEQDTPVVLQPSLPTGALHAGACELTPVADLLMHLAVTIECDHLIDTEWHVSMPSDEEPTTGGIAENADGQLVCSSLGNRVRRGCRVARASCTTPVVAGI